MKDCLRAYTAGSAYAEFEEKRKGTIAPRNVCGLVVYEVNLNQIPARALANHKSKNDQSPAAASSIDNQSRQPHTNAKNRLLRFTSAFSPFPLCKIF